MQFAFENDVTYRVWPAWYMAQCNIEVALYLSDIVTNLQILFMKISMYDIEM